MTEEKKTKRTLSALEIGTIAHFQEEANEAMMRLNRVLRGRASPEMDDIRELLDTIALAETVIALYFENDLLELEGERWNALGTEMTQWYNKNNQRVNTARGITKDIANISVVVNAAKKEGRTELYVHRPKA